MEGIYGFSRGCLTYKIASSGYILDVVILNETDFESSKSLLPWVQIWIGVNNIELLTPEDWFKKNNGTNVGNNHDNSICMPYHSKETF